NSQNRRGVRLPAFASLPPPSRQALRRDLDEARRAESGHSRTGPATANADSPREVAAHGVAGGIERGSDPVRRDSIAWAAKGGRHVFSAGSASSALIVVAGGISRDG